MPAATRTRQQPRVSRETATQAADLAAPLPVGRLIELLLTAYASGNIKLDDCPPYVRSGVDRKQLDVFVDDEIWESADRKREADQLRSMSPLVERLLAAYTNGTFTIGVVRAPHAIAA